MQSGIWIIVKKLNLALNKFTLIFLRTFSSSKIMSSPDAETIYERVAKLEDEIASASGELMYFKMKKMSLKRLG